MIKAGREIVILATHPWEELKEVVRGIHLLKNPQIKPYANAEICLEFMSWKDLYPLSLYLLKPQLDVHRRLRRLFLAEHGVDMFNLQGSIEFSLDGMERLISPPLVEISEIDGGIPVLVDGLHRFWLAREEEIPIRVILVSGVPKELPVTCYPIGWDEVKVYDRVPKRALKRRYRFSTLADVPSIPGLSLGQDLDPHYILFRELVGLGSGLVRPVGGRE